MSASIVQLGRYERFTPAAYADHPSPPVYLLARASHRIRGQFRGAIAAEGLRYPGDRELGLAVLAVVDEAAPPNRDELASIVQAYVDQDAAPLPPVPGDQADQAEQLAFIDVLNRHAAVERAFEVVLDVVRQHPRIGRLLALRTMFGETVPALAASIALKGWENGPGAFRMQLDGRVDDDVLNQIPERDLAAIGARVLAMLARLGADGPPVDLTQLQPLPAPQPAAEPATPVDLAKARKRRPAKAKPH